MRFARLHGATLFGVRAGLVDVQVSMPALEDGGKPTFQIVGLPDSALREGRERVRSAIGHGGWSWPAGPVTVNLAPASARKEGAALDLPIALGVLAASGVLANRRALRGWLCLGELTLDGRVRPVRGVLAATQSACRAGVTQALVPRGNAAEAAAVHGVEVYGIDRLSEAVGHLSGEAPVVSEVARPWRPAGARPPEEHGVRGQKAALQATRVAATGGHNLLLWGPPGAGKTLLARQIIAWLPPLSFEESLEVSRIHSVAGLLDGGLVTRRPFRAPHHTTSLAGLVGGGAIPRPGEMSLAHLGVLFLDELPEFPRSTLESLRQPLEDGRLVVGRAAGRATLPSEVLLVAALNPCPCGWHGFGERCRCTPRDVRRYGARISGPLRDRFDLEVSVKPVDTDALVGDADPERDGPVDAAALLRARRRQERRAARLGLPRAFNARIPARLLPGAVEPSPAARRDLIHLARRLGLTGRGVHRLLRVARTVADLEDAERVESQHVMEASAMRSDLRPV